MKKLLLALLACFCLLKAQAQCSETAQPKVLLVGDSWAFFMSADQTINTVLRKWGFTNYRFLSNATIAVNGAQTDDFLRQNTQDEIARLLNENPTINVVHLSIGGNDVLGGWDTTFTQGQTDTLRMDVENRMIQIFDFIKGLRPDIHILWSGYCYTNFNEVITTSILGNSHPFYGTWSGMKFPTMRAINDIQNEFSNEIEAITQADPRLHYVKATGLMQWAFGQTTPLAIPPGGTYAPQSVSLPFGNPDYPSPVASMRDYGFAKDCFHLSARGYQELLDYHTRKFYHKFLMDDFYALAPADNTVGTVKSDGTTSAELELGGDNSGNSTMILNFNTTGMADTTLSAASVFIRRTSLTGTTPFSGTIHVEVKNGNFGTTAAIEAADYTATGDVAGSGCIYGSPFADGHWTRIDLPAQVLPYIRNTANTQIAISAPGFSGGKAKHSDGSDPELAPVLNLKYGETPVASVNDESRGFALSLFPNPAGDRLQLETFGNEIREVSATDILGSTYALSVTAGGEVSIRHLSAGIYQLRIRTALGEAVRKFVKE
jgi:hypothetical protein